MNYKLIFNEIKQLVDDTPNDMKLGKKIRDYILNPEPYIYESLDGGETVYRRRAGDYDNREKI